MSHPAFWTPPTAGYLKLNFDEDSSINRFCGWGFVLRNHARDIIIVGAQHGTKTVDPLLEEARSCLHAIKCALEFGARNIVIKVDCLLLINMIKSRQAHH